MERENIQRLFEQHYASMYRVARTILYDEQESKDVVSDIFERLLRGETSLRQDTEEHYLLTSVRNQCLKRLRHERIRQDMAAQQSLADKQQVADDDERLTDIMEFVVSHLSAQEQRIFHLRFTDGYSYEEIAAQEGISKVAVWKHLSHLLMLVRNHFNQQEQ